MAHILIIDDDADIRMLVVMLLESIGHTVTEAADGAEGLACLAGQIADCILLDISMPGMNGWEACRRIKANPATANIPVVIFTVRSMLRDEAEFDSIKPDGFLNKPFEKHELFAAVNEAMGRALVS